MAITPHSIIRLCNVPIDNTYKNQIYFGSKDVQTAYFVNKTVKTFTDYSYIRKDGNIGIRVNAHVDDLAICNYVMYQNGNYTNKYFYAFITEMEYKNDNCTEIYFQTDVYQTWLFDVTLKPSYVVREHSRTDNIGANLVPEKFSFQDYVYKTAHTDTTLDRWGYLIGSTENDIEDETFWGDILGGTDKPVIKMRLNSGIMQGLFFYYFPDVHEVAGSGQRMDELLNELVAKNGECIVFIAVIPEFNVSGASVGANDYDHGKGMGWVYASVDPAEKTITIPSPYNGATHDGYEPKNKKLLTSPFFKLVVTNHNGEQGEYAFEDFLSVDANFTMYGDISANPTVTLIPNNYKGIAKNYDAGISIGGFPQVSLNTDTFKLWLSKNQYAVGLDVLANVGQIAAGVAAVAAAPVTGGASLGVGAFLGASGVVSGAQGVLSTINGVYQASSEPNKSTSGGGKTNLLTAMKMNKFEFYIQTLRYDHAKTVDDFFTMYGYQTNEVKVPNVSSRPYFNYVQTVDVNIVGAIPSNDMARLKAVYNSGVTLWKASATVGDYSVDNTP